jgi:trimeric autotransporter adhesin
MKFYLSLILVCATVVVKAQNIGINTTTPATTLDVNGAILTRSTAVNPSANNVSIPDHVSYFVIGNGASCTDTITCFFSGTYLDGQHLTIFNNNACAMPAKFSGVVIPYLSAMNFICKAPGGWYPILAPENPLSNNWTLNGNVVDTSNFIGTTNDAAILFKSNNTPIGSINASDSNIHFGKNYPSATSYTGTNNISLGSSALSKAKTNINNIAIGSEANSKDTSSANSIAIGTRALGNSLASENNIAIGYEALFDNGSVGAFGGIYNTILGNTSAKSNIMGSGNTVTGYSSLVANKYGSNNVIIGSRNLVADTNAFNNVAIGNYNLLYGHNNSTNISLGFYAMSNADSCVGNISIGRQVLSNSLNGAKYNIAIGNYAMFYANKSKNNIAIGQSALLNDTSVENTIAIGNAALYNNRNATGNFAIGDSALYSNSIGASGTEAMNNFAIGKNALYANRKGNANMAIGANTLEKNKTGGGNVAIGLETMANDSNGNGNTVVGVAALVKGSNNNNNVAMGVNALYYANASTNNIALGNNTLNQINNGSDNIAIGKSAGLNLKTARNNIAIGADALKSDTSSKGQIAIGVGALYNTINRNRNLAIGDSALFNNGVGAYEYSHSQLNLAIGEKSMINNTIGEGNTALGAYTLIRNTSGKQNIALSAYSLQNNTTGSYNIGLGPGALLFNMEGSSNIAIGKDALFFNNLYARTINTQSNGNVAIGQSALFENTLGSHNTGVGAHAGYNVRGDNNTIIGAQPYLTPYTQTIAIDSAVFLGYNAGRRETTSNKLYIENTSVGKDSALVYGDFLNDSLVFNAKTIVRDAFKVKNTGGVASVEVGYGTAGKQVDNGVIQYGGFGGGNHVLNIVGGGTSAIGNDRAIKLWVNGGLDILGTPFPAQDNFFSLGTSAKRWSSVWAANGTIQTSDANLKTNITPLNYGLNTVLKLKPVSYNWKATPTSDRNIGFLAQEVQVLVPEAVVDTKDGSPLGMKYTEIIPVLVNAIQEQNKTIEEQKKFIQDQEKINSTLLRRLEALEKK